MNYYVTDGTEDCFYTAVFDAYKDTDCVIASIKEVQLGLDSTIIDVITDTQKAERVKKKLKTLDHRAMRDVTLLLKSNDTLKENIAFNYIKLIVTFGGAVRTMQANPHVLEATDLIHKVTLEVHHMKGFLRFIESADGILYAPFSPENDITDMLCVHFAARLGKQKFVIHDTNRKIAGLYDGEEIVLTSADRAEIHLAEYEKYFENLWRQYYRSVNILSRPHEKQMRASMPVRYWKFLPEKRP